MRNFLILLVAVLIFTACGNSHRRNENKPKEISDSSSVIIPTVTTPTHDSTLDEKFYSEMFYKKDLNFGGTVDSTIVSYEGEGTVSYNLPVKVTYGRTKSFSFRVITAYEYYKEEDFERKTWELEFKIRETSSLGTGKTLAEDKEILKSQEWRCLNRELQKQLRELLPESKFPYPKKFIHKGFKAGVSQLFLQLKISHIYI